MTIRQLLPLALIVITAYGCGSGSSGGGGASTAAPITSAGGASVTSLRVVGAPLVAGDTPVVFRLTDATAAPADVEIHWSPDQGVTWSVATAASGSTALAAMGTGPAPGVEHTFRWETATDIPGFEADVRLRVRAVGGGFLETAAFAVDNMPVSTHVTLNRRPYLQDTRTTQFKVGWRTETSTDTVIEYGTTPALGQTAGDPNAATLEHWVTIDNLQPGTEYYYRVTESGLPITPRHVASTAPVATSTDPVRFVVVGDSGMGNPEQHQIAALMAQEDADFFLHTGDVVYPAGGFPAAVVEYNRRFFEPYGDMLTRVPAFPVVGNHDLYGLFGQPFKQTFEVPDNHSGLFEELYYGFDWGDCRFLALETNTLYKHLGWGPHITWLDNQLSQNTKKWLIVYMHAPLYSAGKHGDDQDLIQRLEPLFERHRVDLVLAGHDHNYERSLPVKAYSTDPTFPGLVHVVTGGGGAALRPVNPTPRTDIAISAHHYMRISIQGDTLSAEAVDINNQVIDSFTVQNH